MEHCRIQSQGRVQTCHISNQSLILPNASLHTFFQCCSTVVPLCWWLQSTLPLLSVTLLYWVTFSSPVHCFCLISWYMDMHSVCCGFYYVKTTFLWPPLSGSFGSALIPVIGLECHSIFYNRHVLPNHFISEHTRKKKRQNSQCWGSGL